MGYDAIAVGNHDIETGHKVYDRIAAQLASYGIPFLAGNALRNDDGKPYFPMYTVIRRGGLKVAILGFTNPNMKGWLNESIWSGMHFESLLPLVQEDVDAVVAKEKPDVVIVAVHSGTGHGDGGSLESQGLDLLHTLRGVDFLVCSHDHRPYTENADSICLVNSGSHCRNLGLGELRLTVRDGKVVSREHSAGLIPIRAERVDTAMRAAFHADYEAAKAFTLREVGELKSDLRTRDAYTGMSDYMNLVHTLGLGCSPAQISFAAPLTYNGFVKAGTLIYNDLFTIYPYENQLYVVRMTGEEIRNYLEFSYNNWIQTLSSPAGHVLRIQERDDPRTFQKGWSFVSRSYNFDSAAGINYTVDVTKPFGERVAISTMASGQPFDPAQDYFVAMTSYRASGGGGLLREGAGIDTDRIDDRVVSRYPEIRNILYQYLLDMGSIDPVVTGDPARIGRWSFVPQPLAGKALARDMALLFP
jgi:2',3'-cyclic-nucleotide 2'-phosphodiesterase/3'-nucleotidase